MSHSMSAHGRRSAAAVCRQAAVVAVALMMSACGSRTVKIGWDPPPAPPDGYHILVDGQIVSNIPPPPLDPSCQCLKTSVRVPRRGKHTISVVAYKGGIESQRASLVVE
jgi:hypothetical protein